MINAVLRLSLYFFASFFLWGLENVRAQEAQEQGCIRLVGFLSDASTGEALSGASLRSADDFATTTNQFGRFEFKCLGTRHQELLVEHLAYKTAWFTISNLEREIRLTLEPDELQLGEVLVERTGLRGGKLTSELPGSSHALDPRELARFESSDVHKMLSSVPGVYIQEEDGYGLRPNIGMRGTGLERSSKITVMEDGVLMAPAPYSASAAYYFPSVGRMHSAEVRKGSSQVKYGPYTNGGALNLQSTPIPSEFDGELKWLVGSDQMYSVHANFGSSFKYGAFLFETYQQGAEGFKEADYDGDLGFSKKDYLAKLQLNSSENAKYPQAFILKLASVNEDANETYLGITQDDFGSTPYRRYAASQFDEIISLHRQIQLQHIVEISSDISLVTSTYRNDFERDWYKLNHLTDEAGSTVSISKILDNAAPQGFLDIIKGDSNSGSSRLHLKHNNRFYTSRGIQSSLSISRIGAKWINEAEFGLRIHMDEMDRFQWVDSYAMREGRLEVDKLGIPGTDSNRIESADAVSFHLQTEHSFGRLTLSPGIRFENASLKRYDYGKEDVNRLGLDLATRKNRVQAWMPGLGFRTDLNGGVFLFGGLHRGFSPPGSQEGGEQESSVNYELGIRKFRGPSHFEFVGFLSDYTNLLGSDLAATGGGGTTQLFNGGEAKVYGLESMVKHDLGAIISWRFSLPVALTYTYTVAKFDHSFDSDNDSWGSVEKGDNLPYLPQQVLSLSSGMQSDRWDLFFKASYTSRMRFEAGVEDLNSSNSTDNPLLISLSSSLQLRKNVNLFAKVDNVSNRVYMVANRPSGFRPGMPRNGSVGIRATLR